MNVLFGILSNGVKSVIFYKDGKYFLPYSDGLESVFSNTINVIKAWRFIKNIDLEETEAPVTFLPPLLPSKIFLPAVNFVAHSEETSKPVLPDPYFFTKFQNSLIGHEGSIRIPRNAQRVDYEGEIGVIIGKRGKYIEEKDALDHVFGYTITNDVSIRDYQLPERHPYGMDWVSGKAADTGLPIGPWIVPSEDLDQFSMTIKTEVNGEVRQNGTTDDMVFSVERLISYLSRIATLEPGDLITTGTPSGVAEYTGARHLKEGDTVEIEVDKIGVLRHYVQND